MTREIKFRARDFKNRIMHNSNILWWMSNCFKIMWTPMEWGLWWDFIDYKIMQYTWLKDRNWNEIYEGDILRYPDWSWPVEVVYRWWCFCIRSYSPPFTMSIEHSCNEAQSRTSLRMEIIWNIYENKELLDN